MSSQNSTQGRKDAKAQRFVFAPLRLCVFALKCFRYRAFLLTIAAIVLVSSAPAQKSRLTPRATIQNFFGHLRAQQYAELYDYLPNQVQQYVTQAQLIQSLRRLGSFIQMERMEIGRIQQVGDFAVIDTNLYGRLKQPLKFEGTEIVEGRVAVQQYMIKEGQEWKVITADERSRALFLEHNPEFSRGFQLSPPQFAYKKDGAWKPIGSGTKQR